MSADPQITQGQKLKATVIAAVVWLATEIAFRLCPIRAVRGQAQLERFLDERHPIILTLWHDRLAYMPWFVSRILKKSGVRVHGLVSRSRDGEIMARFAGFLGYRMVRGSTSRGGVSGLREMGRLLRANQSVATVADGPRGPRYVAKPGPVALAKLGGAPIIPITYATERAWTLNSWDRFILPKPLSGIAVVFGEPMLVPRDAGEQEIAESLAELQRRLQENLAEAKSLVGISGAGDD